MQVKYGMTVDFKGNPVSMKYNPNVQDYGVTNPYTGNIDVVPVAFHSSSELKATPVHEYGHSVRDRILDANGKFVGWQYPSGQFNSSSATLSIDGPIGYSNEIYNAGKLNIKVHYLSPNYNPLWSEWNKRFKWFYVAPQRYTNPVNLLYY